MQWLGISDGLTPIPAEPLEEAGEERLHKLAAFQTMMLKHAMSFPNVTKIVYSTCSLHAIENEHVIQAALDSEEAKVGNFTLAPQNEVLPTWQRRGLSGHLVDPCNAASLIHCLPEDLTNGFFVACFVKMRKREKRNLIGKAHHEPKKKRRTS